MVSIITPNPASWCWTLTMFVWVMAGSRVAAVDVWSAPDLDWLAYVNASGAGNRAFGPSWIGGLEVDGETNQFLAKGKEEPSRLAAALVAFDTSSNVTPGMQPGQYQVNAVTLTMTMASATFPGESLYYDDSPDSQAEILSDILSGDFDSARPMELYGVGFRDGYAGFAFTTSAGDSQLLDEGTHLYASSDGGYLAYPIASDGEGRPLDVSNSITGGFSETAPGNNTAPFDPVPWAIGSIDLPVGAAIPDDSTFSFDLDLSEPGVRDYVQQSLTEGGIGFFVSSQTLATQPGLGVFPYPQWYLKESVGIYPNAMAPTLEIDYSILPLPGDFNTDAIVNADDLAVWELSFGVSAGADADADEDSDGADFVAWQRSYEAPPPPSAAAVVVPEPLSLALLLLGFSCLALHYCKRRHAEDSENDE